VKFDGFMEKVLINISYLPLSSWKTFSLLFPWCICSNVYMV